MQPPVKIDDNDDSLTLRRKMKKILDHAYRNFTAVERDVSVTYNLGSTGSTGGSGGGSGTTSIRDNGGLVASGADVQLSDDGKVNADRSAVDTISLSITESAMKLDDFGTPDDNTDLDVSTSVHGLVPKAPNDQAQVLRGDASWGACQTKLDDLGTPDDNTDLNATTTYHGLLPKLDDDATHFLDGDGAWNDPLSRSINTYTQTYSTADRTHANMTSVELSDGTGGSKDNTLSEVTDQSETTDNSVINDNFAELAEELNALRNDVIDLKQLVNAIIDDLQSVSLID